MGNYLTALFLDRCAIILYFINMDVSVFKRTTIRYNINEANIVHSHEGGTDALSAIQVDQVLQVKMFGGFSMRYGADIHLEDTGRSRKVWNLLEYLLINHKRDLSQEDLIAFLCQDDDSINPSNTLKNLIYRLRQMLADYGLPADECIVFERGVYSWNSEIPCDIDAELFEQKRKDAQNPGLDENGRLACYLDAIELYRGKFLPKSAYEEWAIPLAAYYHRLYIECINGAYDILSKRQEFEPLVSICRYAISIDPYDEGVYQLLIESLIHLGRNKDAMEAYETITNTLFSELGVNPSDRTRQLYREIMQTTRGVEPDLLIIKEDLKEAEKKKGAYLCDYGIFQDIYRFVARSIERSGQSVYILLYTMTDRKGELLPVETLTPAMEKLQDAVVSSLRRGDLVSRYSSSQFVIVLSGTSFENGCMVAERIVTAFQKSAVSRRVRLRYSVQPMDPAQ